MRAQGEGLLTEAGSRALVDQLFAFSHSLGTRYTGRWLDSSSFVVTMVDTSGATVPVDVGAVSLSVVGDIKNANERSRWCKAVRALSGSVGTLEPPSIARFDSQTWDLQDVYWSRYDTLEVALDLRRVLLRISEEE